MPQTIKEKRKRRHKKIMKREIFMLRALKKKEGKDD
jgi:hypothetical protein